MVSLLSHQGVPGGLRPFGGSSYWCITRDGAAYISEFTKKNPKFVNFFKYVYIPDEMFFQTIILNSYLRDTVVNDDLRCIDWSAKGRGSTLPRVWCKEDIGILSRSSALIARKFDNAVDSTVFDLIDAELLSD